MSARTDHPARRRNPLTALVLVLGVLLASLSACGLDEAASTTTPDDNLGDTATFVPVTPGSLTVVTSLPAPGFYDASDPGSDEDPTAIRSGYEYELAQELRRKLGLEHLILRSERFDDIVAGRVGGYDIALSQVSITEARRQLVDFTKPYFESRQSALVRSGTAAPETATDARQLRWAVVDGSTAETLLDSSLHPVVAPAVYPDLDHAYEALASGQVDALLADTAVNLGEAARSDGRMAVVAQFEQTGGPDLYGGVVPKGSPNLAIFDALITDLHKTGELKQLAREHLTKDPDDVPIIQL